MPEPRLISSYLDALAAQLPASMVEELADGLAETHRSYLRQGLAPEVAARTGAAGFLGVIALDASLIASVAFAGVPLTWVLGLAMAASAARLCYAARALRPALAG